MMRLIFAIALPAALLAQTNAESNGELLLRDFHPKTRLDVKQTQIVHAKFPVIDVHFHMDPANDPEKVAQTMDQLNLQMVVNLGNHDMWGEALRSYVAKWVKPYPSRFAVMANIDPKMINDPDFGAKAVARLKEDVKNGAIALKIYKDLGLVWRDTNGKRIRPDDARFEPVWYVCAELGIPVLIDVNDTMPFFDAIDRCNERYLSLTLDRRSSWYGKVDVTHEQLMQMFEHIIGKHLRTTFIGAHVGMHYEHLYTGARWLDMYPNLYYDSPPVANTWDASLIPPANS
jgi:predicted TIM-barrel fold metal-dependent hydrolase